MNVGVGDVWDSNYASLGHEIGALVTVKNLAYGDAFGKAGAVLRLLYPDGVKPEQYDDMLTLVRIIDKLFRIATRKEALGESPYIDIAGYALLGAVRDGATVNVERIVEEYKRLQGVFGAEGGAGACSV